MAKRIMLFPMYFWVIFICAIGILVAIDLYALGSQDRTPTMRESLAMVSIWVLLASLFCTFLIFYAGTEKALEFASGYLVELALSIDNVFVFLLIFMYMKVPVQYQHRVLFWGVLSAIAMRFAMIMGGIYMFEKFKWLFYVFGAFLIYSGGKIFFIKDEADAENDKPRLLNFLKRFGRFTPEFHGHNFFVKTERGWCFTPLFVALLLVEKADLIFALDSIPAVIAITNDPFIVYTSNIFAILGLRSLYFLVEKLVARFRYLKYGIAVILSFIGLKMILSMQQIHFPLGFTLLFIVCTLGITTIASWYLTRGKSNSEF